jgi:hypothetical protein
MRIVSRHSFCRTRAPHVRSNALLPKEAECYQQISVAFHSAPAGESPSWIGGTSTDDRSGQVDS